MMVLFKRITKAGWKSFSRNIGLNTAMIFILAAVVLFADFLFIFNAAAKILIADVQSKVDISVYFKDDASYDDIAKIESEVKNIPEVASVKYVSKEECLADFIETHKGDTLLLDSIKEIGGNPFLAALNIKAVQASQYEQIAKFFENSSFGNLIEKVDYYQRKPIMDKIFSAIEGINKGGLGLTVILALIAVLIAFNTIKIAIYNMNEEISTMRLVGASNWFIRGPFLVQGAINGLIAFLIAFPIIFVVCFGFDAKIKFLTPDISSLGIFLYNFWWLLLIQFVCGIGLGVVSTYIAVRKYLKV